MKRNIVCIILMTFLLSAYAEDVKLLDGIWRDKGFYEGLTSNLISSADYEGRGMKYTDSRTEIRIRSDSTGYYWSVSDFSIYRIEQQSDNKFVLYLSKAEPIGHVGEMFVTIIDENSIFVAQSERLSLDEGYFVRVSGPAKIPLQYGVINDTRVRLRTKPNLECDTWGFFNTGDAVTIIDKSAETQKIGDMEDYWYKVQTELFPDGWVYGAFIDIED